MRSLLPRSMYRGSDWFWDVWKRNGSDAKRIYLRLSFTNGGGSAANLILFVIAHVGAVNCNGRRVRISGVLRPELKASESMRVQLVPALLGMS